MSVGGSSKFIRCSALKIGGLSGAMDQFASKWNCEELCIRYVSGPRNQKFFIFNNFAIPQPSELTISYVELWKSESSNPRLDPKLNRWRIIDRT
jgi:hypothetical protein